MFNKKGLVKQIEMVLILFIVLAFIIGMFSLVAIAAPLLVGEGKTAINMIQTSVSTTEPTGSPMSNATSVAAEAARNILGSVEILVYLSFFGLFIGYILICYYVRSYPFLAVFWVFVIIFLTIFAMFLSNAYQQAAAQPDLNSFYTTWGSNHLMMNYLPHLIALFGVCGGVFLFVLVSREPEAEVQDI